MQGLIGEISTRKLRTVCRLGDSLRRVYFQGVLGLGLGWDWGFRA